jgi:hypothetical protein
MALGGSSPEAIVNLLQVRWPTVVVILALALALLALRGFRFV